MPGGLNVCLSEDEAEPLDIATARGGGADGGLAEAEMGNGVRVSISRLESFLYPSVWSCFLLPMPDFPSWDRCGVLETHDTDEAHRHTARPAMSTQDAGEQGPSGQDEGGDATTAG